MYFGKNFEEKKSLPCHITAACVDNNWAIQRIKKYESPPIYFSSRLLKVEGRTYLIECQACSRTYTLKLNIKEKKFSYVCGIISIFVSLLSKNFLFRGFEISIL